jgi:hypothetical protein
MSRLFLAALVSAVIVYIGLYFYDSSVHTWLYTAIAVALALGFIVGVAHMLFDRGVTAWTPTAVAILYVMGSMGALFALLFWQRQFGRLSPGDSQAWVDVVIATAVIGLPLWFLSIGRYRLNKWRGQYAMRPSDEVDGGIWDGTTERRVGPPDRRGYVAPGEY